MSIKDEISGRYLKGFLALAVIGFLVVMFFDYINSGKNTLLFIVFCIFIFIILLSLHYFYIRPFCPRCGSDVLRRPFGPIFYWSPIVPKYCPRCRLDLENDRDSIGVVTSSNDMA